MYLEFLYQIQINTNFQKQNNIYMKLYLALFMLLFTQVSLLAQNKVIWGKTTVEELQYKECTFDKDAEAVVLYESGKLDLSNYNKGAELKVHVRVKILSENALDRGDIRISYYAKNKYEQVKDIKAQTINSEDGFNAKVYTLKKDGIFDVKINEEYKEIRFTLPKVQKGSILEYTYTILTKNIDGSRPWNFQNSIPTLYSELEVGIASYFTYNIHYQGNMLAPKYQNAKTTEIIRGTKYYWFLKNVPAIKQETCSPYAHQYVEQLSLKITGYYVSGLAKNSYEGKKKNYEEIGKPIPKLAQEHFEDNDDISKYLRKNKVYKDILAGLINENDNHKTKFLKVYKYVQEKIRSNEEYGIFIEQTPNELFEKKRGAVSEINLFFIGLLKQAGINAHPILLSTRDYKTVNKEGRSLRQFNQIASSIKVDNQRYEIDASQAEYPYDLLNEECFGHWAYVYEGKDKGTWIVPDAKQMSKTQLYCITKISEQGTNYHLNLKFSGYEGLRQRIHLSNTKTQSKFVNHLLIDNENTDISINDFEIKNADKKTQSLVVNVKAKNEEVSTQEEMIYLDFFKFQDYREAIFKDSERWLPVDFSYPFSDNYIVDLELPTGYELVDIPHKEEVNILDNTCTFLYVPTQIGNSLQIVAKIIIRKHFFTVKQYPELKEFFETISTKLAEPIVLKKK